MANPTQRHGPLDHLGLAARAQTEDENGVHLTVLPVPQIIELRGAWSDAFASAVCQVLRVNIPSESREICSLYFHRRRHHRAYWNRSEALIQ